jgi:hypothetical protein
MFFWGKGVFKQFFPLSLTTPMASCVQFVPVKGMAGGGSAVLLQYEYSSRISSLSSCHHAAVCSSEACGLWGDMGNVLGDGRLD